MCIRGGAKRWLRVGEDIVHLESLAKGHNEVINNSHLYDIIRKYLLQMA